MSKTDRYQVVFQTMDGNSKGCIWRQYFDTKAEFETWYSGKMKDGTNDPINKVYAVVAQGVSDKQAEALCSSFDARLAATTSFAREMNALGRSGPRQSQQCHKLG